MFERLKSLIKRYDDFLDTMGIKSNEKRCCVPVVRFDPEPEAGNADPSSTCPSCEDQNSNQKKE